MGNTNDALQRDLEISLRSRYCRQMVFKMINRFFYLLMTVLIIFGTVKPGFSTIAGSEQSRKDGMFISTDSVCPRCGKSQSQIDRCIQVSCVDFAVLNDQGFSHLPDTHPSYIVTSAIRPTAYSLALITPPI